jgi:hypothetical protein
MRHPEHVKLAIEEIERLGGTVHMVERKKGNHPQITFDIAGRVGKLACAGSSCSVRGTWNQQASIRRFAKTGRFR